MSKREVIAGRFTVVKLRGAGGMGLVYAVEDERFPGGQRALKVLRDEYVEDAKARARFADEVKAAARVKSAHVVTVYEYDVVCERPWMVMELLEGETLEERVASKGPLPWDIARTLVVELGHGLGAAHAVGLLHLDLKPANVFLARQQDAYGREQVKVMDFGISRQLLEGKTSAKVSQGLGTIIWMPPEQGSRRAELRPSADVWPLGLIAFWMLTAKHYWTTIADNGEPDEILPFHLEVAKGAVTPASERARERGSERALPEGFDAWFARCVASDPKSRWPNGAEATGALEEILSRASRVAEEVSVPPQSPLPPTRDVTPPPPPPTVDVPTHARTADVARKPMPPAGFTQRSIPPLEALKGQTAIADPRDLPKPPAPVRKSSAAWLATATMLIAAGVGVWAASEDSPAEPAPVDSGPIAVASRVDAGPTSVVPPQRPPSVPTPQPHCAQGTVLIPAGTFQMGSPTGVGEANERPQHAVTLASFCMDRTEVTVAAYSQCVSAGNCVAAYPTVNWSGYNAEEHRLLDPTCNRDRADRQQHPVNCVDWTQANAYCRAVGGRLPTEAEWEYGARGTDGRTYPWGNERPDVTRLNGRDNDFVTWETRQGLGDARLFRGHDGWGNTAPVGSYPAGRSPFGLEDMAGNVWEWTSDSFVGYTAGAQQNPMTGSIGNYRVSRGGGWDVANASWFRSAFRYGLLPTHRVMDLGFRCARGVTP